MSTYGAILGASIGVILLCLVVMVACYCYMQFPT